MPADKDRLYIALYVRSSPPTMPGKEDTYHWGFITGPKIEDGRKGMRYHARDRIGLDGSKEWMFEDLPIRMDPTQLILARICIGKIIDKGRLDKIMRETPIRGTEPGWNCVFWVREAIERLEKDGKSLGTSILQWDTVRDTAMDYVEKKKTEHRYDGQGNFDQTKVATYSLLENKELIP